MIYLIALLSGLGIGTGLAAAAFIVWLLPHYGALKREKEEQESIKANLKKEAEVARSEILVAAKADAFAMREKANEEIRQRQLGLEKQEAKLDMREEALQTRREQLEDREHEILENHRELTRKQEGLDEKRQFLESMLQNVAGMSKDEAKELFLKQIEDEFQEAGLRKIKEIESNASLQAERKATKLVLDTMQKNVLEQITRATVTTIQLPSEDMKGRIIGREGRNIRSFEQVTGVDLIIDESPEAVVISTFDPMRRETARRTLQSLIEDGRIHPVKIEEAFEKAVSEVNNIVREEAEKAMQEAGIADLPEDVIEMVGKLHFRTSYGQNVLDHSVEVAKFASNLAAELGLNVEVTRRAAFLHDIGKALGPEWEGPHALTGMEYLRKHGEKEPVLLAVGAHHNEIEPTSAESVLVIIADTMSAARPGARSEQLENYLQRLQDLEKIAYSFDGVDSCYAVQAGREIRLIVKPDKVNDLGAKRLANQVAKKIEESLEFPGQIKVTVIRETRVQHMAK